jgi:hypothetical protein
MKLALASISYIITAVALVLLAIRVQQLIAIYKKQQPDPTRSNDRAEFAQLPSFVLGFRMLLRVMNTVPSQSKCLAFHRSLLHGKALAERSLFPKLVAWLLLVCSALARPNVIV